MIRNSNTEELIMANSNLKKLIMTGIQCCLHYEVIRLELLCPQFKLNFCAAAVNLKSENFNENSEYFWNLKLKNI